jgi:phosphohistidine phosphatase
LGIYEGNFGLNRFRNLKNQVLTGRFRRVYKYVFFKLASHQILMKQLILLRHGEAAFSSDSDFKRPLTEKGKKQLNNLGQILKLKRLEIDRMYCSSSTRTKETAQIIGNYNLIKEEKYEHEIYSANLELLLTILEKTSSKVQNCLLIGHNPAISLLTSYLTSGEYIGLEPGMMVILELKVEHWSMIGVNTASLLEVIS